MAMDPLLAKIHIAKKDLQLDDSTYRAAIDMISNGKTDSSAKLNRHERLELIKHFESLGWKAKPQKRRPKNADQAGSRARHIKKIEALLTVGNKPWSYADAMAKRMYKVDSVSFLEDTKKLRGIITALIKQGKKEGWDLEK